MTVMTPAQRPVDGPRTHMVFAKEATGEGVPREVRAVLGCTGMQEATLDQAALMHFQNLFGDFGKAPADPTPMLPVA